MLPSSLTRLHQLQPDVAKGIDFKYEDCFTTMHQMIPFVHYNDPKRTVLGVQYFNQVLGTPLSVRDLVVDYSGSEHPLVMTPLQKDINDAHGLRCGVEPGINPLVAYIDCGDTYEDAMFMSRSYARSPCMQRELLARVSVKDLSVYKVGQVLHPSVDHQFPVSGTVERVELTDLPRAIEPTFVHRQGVKRTMGELAAGTYEGYSEDTDERRQKIIGCAIESMCLKLVMNSMYGVMGSGYCALYSIVGGAAVSGMGRWVLSTIQFVYNGIGVHTFYCDTDSVFAKVVDRDFTDSGRSYLHDSANTIWHEVMKFTICGRHILEKENDFGGSTGYKQAVLPA